MTAPLCPHCRERMSSVEQASQRADRFSAVQKGRRERHRSLGGDILLCRDLAGHCLGCAQVRRRSMRLVEPCRSLGRVGGVTEVWHLRGDLQRALDSRMEGPSSAPSGRPGCRAGARECYVFTAAKRFQEQEHGGLICFMRTADDKVFTRFDAESQDLGVSEQNPLTSSFRPMSELVMVRARNTGFVIGTTLSGVPLEPGDPIAIGARQTLKDVTEDRRFRCSS